MPIDVHDFSIPESDFSGLHRVAQTIERQTERKDLLKRQELGRKNASAAFLSNWLDPKDHLTGTNYDPQIVSGFDDLLQQGSKLASEGADTNMIMMALSPKVAKLNQYSTTAKLISQRIKDQLSHIPDKSGYDKEKLDQLARKNAFYNEDGSMKEIGSIDPNTDWLTETIKLQPDEVTNDAAIDEFVKTSPKFVNTQRVKRTNSRGGYELKKSKVTAPSWATVDDNGEIVPRYDTAMDEGEPHMHEFVDKNGKKVSAPIRLMQEKDFDSMMASNPGIADFVRGQVRKVGMGADMNTPQAKNAGRAIMYDELKRRGGGGIEDIEETKANPIHIHNGSGSKDGGEVNIRNIYKEITEKGGGHSKGYVPLIDLTTGAQSIALKQARDLSGDNTLGQQDIYISKYPDGRVVIKKVTTPNRVSKDDPIIGEMDFGSTNIPAQPGVKEKREVIRQGNNVVTSETYSDTEENGISNFMKSNGLSRKDAIKILKENGRLK